MRFHIDTRSAAQADEGSTFDFRNTLSVAGSFGWGPWGVSASMQNTIGYVSTSQTQTTEEMNVDLDLNSSVELVFRTDQVPLNRLASAGQTARILANSRNPETEARLDSEERRARRDTQRQTEQGRRTSLRELTTPPLLPRHDPARLAQFRPQRKPGVEQPVVLAEPRLGRVAVEVGLAEQGLPVRVREPGARLRLRQHAQPPWLVLVQRYKQPRPRRMVSS